MLSPEEIAEQQQLLAAHRRTLAIYLKQQAMIGRAHSPPALINGIEDARSTIRRIKRILTDADVAVPNDPDDDSSTATLPRLDTVLPQDRALPGWLWPVVASSLAIVLAIGGGWWWLSNQPSDPSVPAAMQPAADEATAPAADEATPAEEAPAAETNTAELEEQLMEANIALSAVQVDQVREFINDPGTPYKQLAEHALQVVGDQRFRDTLYLDELDGRYTNLIREEQHRDFEQRYLAFDEEQLKEAMVRTWNGRYTDDQVDVFEQIVEPRS
jgi:hypothetical protein